jgi:hypothetical protein
MSSNLQRKEKDDLFERELTNIVKFDNKKNCILRLLSKWEIQI